MSISNIIILAIGVVLAIVGLILVLDGVGLPAWGHGIEPPIFGVIVGLLLIGIGVFIARGGQITA